MFFLLFFFFFLGGGFGDLCWAIVLDLSGWWPFWGISVPVVLCFLVPCVSYVFCCVSGCFLSYCCSWALALDPCFSCCFWGGGFGDLCWAFVLDLSCWLVLGVSLLLLSSCSGPLCFLCFLLCDSCCLCLNVVPGLLSWTSCFFPVVFFWGGGGGGGLGTYAGLLFFGSLLLVVFWGSLFLLSSCSGPLCFLCCCFLVFLVVSVLLLFLGSCPGPHVFPVGFGGGFGDLCWAIVFWIALVGWVWGSLSSCCPLVLGPCVSYVFFVCVFLVVSVLLLFLGSCPGPHVFFLLVFFFLGGGGLGTYAGLLFWISLIGWFLGSLCSCCPLVLGPCVSYVFLFVCFLLFLFYCCSWALVLDLMFFSCWFFFGEGGGFWGLMLGYCFGSLLLVGFGGISVLVVLLFWAPVFPMSFVCVFLVVYV